LKNNFRYITLLAVLLILTNLTSCKDKDQQKKGEYSAVCATIKQSPYANRDCWYILIESGESIENIKPTTDAPFVFFVDNLPNEFKVNNIQVTITFNLSKEIRQCGFGMARVADIVAIKKCENVIINNKKQ